MEHNAKEYKIHEACLFAACEPAIDMDLFRTKPFLEGHNRYKHIECAVPLDEGFEL